MRLLAFFSAALVVLSSGCSVVKPASRPTSVTTEVSLTANHTSENITGAGRGNGRNGGLPPGIAKNLEVGKPLPPGIAKQYVTHDVLLRLPPLSEGYEYIVVAGKILVIAIATQIVHDILEDVLFD